MKSNLTGLHFSFSVNGHLGGGPKCCVPNAIPNGPNKNDRNVAKNGRSKRA